MVDRVEGCYCYIAKIGCKRVPGSEGFMSDSVLPDAENRLGEPFKKKIMAGYIAWTSYANIYIWRGGADYRSWYA